MAACYKLDLINVQYQLTLHINKTLHSKIQLVTDSFVYIESVGCPGWSTMETIYCRTLRATYSAEIAQD